MFSQFERFGERGAPISLVGVLLSLSFSSLVAGQALPSQPESAAVPCSIAARGSGVTESLICADKADAMRQLDEMGCFGNNGSGVNEVREVWKRRESLPADAAARDPIVQAFMANCLVEASVRAHGRESADPSAVAYLRNSLTSPTAALSGTAMIGLAPVLTKEDIATIVRVASTDSTLAMPAMAALSINCTAEAKAGIATIRATAAGSPQATDIDHFIAGSEGLCDRKGQSDPKAFVGRVAVAPPAGTVLLSAPDVTQVRAALNSSYTKPSLPYAKPALQVLLAVQCTQGPADVVEEMRRAWHERDSPGASDTMRDPVVQAIIATCLIEADAPSKRLTPEAVEATRLLRASIHSDDVTAVMSAVTGLAIIGSDEDIRSIADVPKRLPSLLTSVIRFAGFTCGASNLKALALIRKELTTEELRDQFDAVYKHVEAVRKQQRCGDQQ